MALVESKPARRDVIPWSQPLWDMVGANKSWAKLTEEEPSPWTSTRKGTMAFHGIPKLQNPVTGCAEDMSCVHIPSWAPAGTGDGVADPLLRAKTAPDVSLQLSSRHARQGQAAAHALPLPIPPPSTYLHPSKPATCQHPAKLLPSLEELVQEVPAQGFLVLVLLPDAGHQHWGGTSFEGHTGKYLGRCQEQPEGDCTWGSWSPASYL